MIPNIYVRGLVVATMNSHEDFGDRKDDYVLKRLLVKAERNDIGDWELVACVEVETVCIVGGTDEGELGPSVEAYRMPFPSDPPVRVSMLREMKKQPRFFAA